MGAAHCWPTALEGKVRQPEWLAAFPVLIWLGCSSKPHPPGAAVLQLDKPLVGFGMVDVGTTAASLVRVTNIGGSPSGMLSTSAAGDSAFALADDGCRGRVLAAG